MNEMTKQDKELLLRAVVSEMTQCRDRECFEWDDEGRLYYSAIMEGEGMAESFSKELEEDIFNEFNFLKSVIEKTGSKWKAEGF